MVLEEERPNPETVLIRFNELELKPGSNLSGITESSLWEASIFPVLQQANYQFPTEMLSAIAKKMDQA